MRPLARHLSLLLLLSTCALAAPKPPKADQVLSEARSKAVEQHKAILLVFGASWCLECAIFDRYFARPEISAVLDKYFVVVHLTVFEELRGKGERNNPGADNVIGRVGGMSPNGEVSLPFTAILDEKGSPIITSNRPAQGKPHGENIGFPAEDDEITWFMTMVKRGAPTITADDALTLQDRLQRGVP